MKRLLLTALLVSSYFTSFAQISVSPILIDTGSQKIQAEMKRGDTVNVRVSNLDKNQRAFVSVTPVLMRAENYVNNDKKNKEMSNANSQKYGFIVSPKRFIIPAGSSQVVKFIFLPTKQRQVIDHIYRVYIAPTDNLSLKEKSKLAGVRVSIHYAVLVIQRPKGAKANLDASCKSGALTFNNTGATNILLSDFKACDKNDKCTKLDANKRLYAKSTWKLDVKNANTIKYTTYLANKQTNAEASCQ